MGLGSFALGFFGLSFRVNAILESAPALMFNSEAIFDFDSRQVLCRLKQV